VLLLTNFPGFFWQPTISYSIPTSFPRLFCLESPVPALILCHPGVVHLTYTNTQKRNIGEYIFNTPWYDGWYRYETLWDVPAAPNIFWDCMCNSIIYILCMFVVDFVALTSTWGHLEQHLPCLDVHPNYFAEFTTHNNQFMYILFIYIYGYMWFKNGMST